MFDTSFKRSQVYFRTLEMLRIFAENIRETGRDLQEMNPDRLLQRFFRAKRSKLKDFLPQDPMEDAALWKNWQTLSDFQRKIEDRLLRRIAEKTEEIRSLRDGVCALREAINCPPSDKQREAANLTSAVQRECASRGIPIDHHEPICHCADHHDRSLPPAKPNSGTRP